MSARELEPIQVRVTIPLPRSIIFRAFVQEIQLESWLCDDAVVEPRVGGRYELKFLETAIPFLSTGKITRINPDFELAFTFLGPPQFQGGLWAPDGRSEVLIRLSETPAGIDLTCEHGGWRNNEAGEEAKAWHLHHWVDRLDELKRYLAESARP
jgi:uncharacterized protein YndB with AHSA1/START domain